MPEARTAEEIRQTLMASWSTQTDIYDPEEASRVNGIAGGMGLQLEASDNLTLYLLRSFGLNVFGQALDDRCAQIPGFEPRREASPAQGAVMTLLFDTSVGESVVPVGTVFGAGEVRFVLTAAVTRLAGSSTYPAAGQSYAYVVCSQPGTVGNVPGGSITQVISVVDNLIGANNVAALNNGMTRETDAQLQNRALNYYAGGLGRLTPPGIVALALAFTSSLGTRCRHAVVKIDPTRPMGVVIVDNGTGFAGAERVAEERSGTVPLNGQLVVATDLPLVANSARLFVNDGGGFVEVDQSQFTAISERGVLYMIPSSTALQPGYQWKTTSPTAYIDFIAEFQALIEGSLQWLGRQAGYRTTSGRLRVVRPLVENVEYTGLLVVNQGFDPIAAATAVRNAILGYHLGLAPGQPVLLLDLYALIARIAAVANFHLVDRDDPSVPMGDVYPVNDESKLSTSAALVMINGSVG